MLHIATVAQPGTAPVLKTGFRKDIPVQIRAVAYYSSEQLNTPIASLAT